MEIATKESVGRFLFITGQEMDQQLRDRAVISHEGLRSQARFDQNRPKSESTRPTSAGRFQ